jgi:adenylate cyclase
MPALKKKYIFLFLSSFILILLFSSFIIKDVFKDYELKIFDKYINTFRVDAQPHEKVKLVLIDDFSLNYCSSKLGRWPWPRSAYADVIDFLMLGKPKAIFFDLFFFEDDKQKKETDAFVNAIKEAGNIYVGMQFTKEKEEQYKKRSMPNDIKNKFSLKVKANTKIDFSEYQSFLLPIPEINNAIKGLCGYEIKADSDGVFRRAPLLFRFAKDYYSSLSLSAINEVVSNESEILIEKNKLILGPKKILLDNKAQAILNWYPKGFSAYSISGLIDSWQCIKDGDFEDILVSPKEFEDSIVIIGASAISTYDLKPTPINVALPGPEIHATLISNILKNEQIIWASQWIVIFATLLLIIFTIWSLLFLSNFWLRYFSGTVLLFAYFIITIIGFRNYYLYLPIIPAFTAYVIAYLNSLVFITFTETKERKRIKRSFEKYLSPSVLEEVLNSYSKLEPGVGRSIEATILFTDIRGFTNISENYPVEQVVNLLNEYFELMLNEIYQNKGTVDKMIGDAIMAFWNAPVSIPEHPLLAVQTAMKMQEILKHANEQWQAKDYPEIKIGVGINTGEVIIGNIGSSKRLDYTAIGDNVNLASRLEGLCKKYYANIVISQNTYEHIKDYFNFRILGKVQVKGKRKSITIYEPFNNEKRKLVEKWQECHDLYLAKEWKKAKGKISEFIKEFPEDLLAKDYLSKIEHFILNPPDHNWLGVDIIDNK